MRLNNDPMSRKEFVAALADAEAGMIVSDSGASEEIDLCLTAVAQAVSEAEREAASAAAWAFRAETR